MLSIYLSWIKVIANNETLEFILDTPNTGLIFSPLQVNFQQTILTFTSGNGIYS